MVGKKGLPRPPSQHVFCAKILKNQFYICKARQSFHACHTVFSMSKQTDFLGGFLENGLQHTVVGYVLASTNLHFAMIYMNIDFENFLAVITSVSVVMG